MNRIDVSQVNIFCADHKSKFACKYHPEGPNCPGELTILNIAGGGAGRNLAPQKGSENKQIAKGNEIYKGYVRCKFSRRIESAM